jgi:hypothetical protein
MKYVVDASVAVEFLLRTPVGRQVETLLAEALLIAPPSSWISRFCRYCGGR